METKITKMFDEISDKAEVIGSLKERSRIMSELEKANLPAGVWTLIKEIINPN